MSVYKKLYEKFNNIDCDSIECYANVTSNVLNEFTIDTDFSFGNIDLDFGFLKIKSKTQKMPLAFSTILLLMSVGAITGAIVAILGNNKKQKQIDDIMLKHLSQSEIDLINDTLSRDSELGRILKEINDTKDFVKLNSLNKELENRLYHVLMNKDLVSRFLKARDEISHIV